MQKIIFVLLLLVLPVTAQNLGEKLKELEEVLQKLQDEVDTAEKLKQKLDEKDQQIEQLERENAELKKKLIEILEEQQKQIQKLQNTIEKGNPWERFSDNIRDIVNNDSDHEYEYALYRNGDFRSVNKSQWNYGWRVMTAPYMTKDNNFYLGGSMWVWDTQSSNDDPGTKQGPHTFEEGKDVYHHYYYHKDGTVKIDGGNGITKPGQEIVYRRKRK